MSGRAVELVEMIRVACLLEATARKPGNVHPEASFEDLTYADFVAAADVAAPALAAAGEIGVGESVLAAVRRTREAVGRNVNLGIALLLAPLAAVPREAALEAGLGEVLGRLDQRDAAAVYEAIRLAQPGGMGRVEDQDVANAPTQTLLEVMRLAAERDQIAAEYAGGFRVVLGAAAAHFATSPRSFDEWNRSIVQLQLMLLAREGDSLIARKCGAAVAGEVQRRAARALQSFDEQGPTGAAVLEFDRWLRGDGHRRNPGTTADLIAAILFAAFREGRADVRAARDAIAADVRRVSDNDPQRDGTEI